MSARNPHLGVVPPKPPLTDEEVATMAFRARALVNRRPKVELGARWPVGPVVRQDTSTGAFESINSRIVDSTIELSTQRALLLAIPASVKKRIDAIQKDRRRTPRHGND